MTTQLVALLRGVNVGRANRIAMADLRALLSDLGYEDVRTLLQSGNAVFRADDAACDSAAGEISAALAAATGIRAAVVVRTADEFHRALSDPPLFALMTDPARYLVGFLDGDPHPRGIGVLTGLQSGADRVQFRAREAFLWLPDGVIASPVMKPDWARTLGVQVTMRNWTTASKLAAMLG